MTATATKHWVVEDDETAEYYTDEFCAEEAASRIADDWDELDGPVVRPKIVEMAVLPWAEYEAMQSQLAGANKRIAEGETAPMGYCGRPGNPDAVLLPLADDRNWNAK
jgi:hypothetical protein